MRNPLGGVALVILLIVVLFLAFTAFFTVDPTEQALVLRFGESLRLPIDAPGLHAKWPFIDSVVFVDDSPMELAEVGNRHPAIECRLFTPDDPNKVAALINEFADLFGKPFDSAEDSLRLQSLRGGAELRSETGGAESLEYVLAGAGGVLKIATTIDPPDPRALELVNKTNQFNLNGRRFNESEWMQYLHQPDHLLWVAAYEDRFGPLGKISVLTGRLRGEGVLELDTWVLSCRAFARRIEYAILAALFQQFSLHQIRFNFEATARNGPIQELLSSLSGAPPGDSRTLDFTTFEERKPAWYIDVRFSDG